MYEMFCTFAIRFGRRGAAYMKQIGSIATFLRDFYGIGDSKGTLRTKPLESVMADINGNTELANFID
jgi:hypothetical protein